MNKNIQDIINKLEQQNNLDNESLANAIVEEILKIAWKNGMSPETSLAIQRHFLSK